MRLLSLQLAMAALLVGVPGAHPCAAAGSYWAGHMKEAQFNFGKKRAELPSPDAGRQWESADFTLYTFNVSQNPQGVVRHDFASISRNRGLEPGLDVRLYNYAEGYMISFNKGAKKVFKTPMPAPGASLSQLKSRQILGHRCKGVEMRWNDMNHLVVVVEQWTPVDCDFRGPLLKVTSISNPGGRLMGYWVEVITDLERVGHLDDSLFSPPAGVAVQSLQ